METLDTTFTSNSNFLCRVYYRMLLRNDGLICIVTMQDFDEFDYDEDRFVRDKDGVRYYWDDEEDAEKQLVEWYEKEEVGSKYELLFLTIKNSLLIR